MRRFPLPAEIAELAGARNRLREHYRAKLARRGVDLTLRFAFDGNLVGDLGEALAVDLFGVELVSGRSTEGIDGHTADGRRSVQVKATGSGRGPAFRRTETRADHLLFFDLDLHALLVEVVYNGPKHRAVSMLPEVFTGQRSLTRVQIRHADHLVTDVERLPLLVDA